jgi:hypothetical protein
VFYVTRRRKLPWSAGFFDVSDEQAKVVVVGEGYEDHVLLSLDGT